MAFYGENMFYNILLNNLHTPLRRVQILNIDIVNIC